MAILETKGLYHDFSGLQVLFDVNLVVREGERHAIIGPNGAGKTTLFNVITGMYKPTRGRVFFKGRDVTGFRPYRLLRLGLGRSFQITSTFSRLTTFQNVRMGILSRRDIRFNLLKRVDSMDEITQETEEMLRRVNLFEEKDLPAAALSYGKHRCLEISMAMATDPDLILLDEPTAGMSRDETHQTVRLIRRLTEGKTTIIIEYGSIHVLQGVSMDVEDGEIVGLLGRNGMGKSTTLKSIMGLVKPRSGRVIYKGKDLTGAPPYKVARAGIGYVPEERRIFPTLTVLDNLAMGVKGGRFNKKGTGGWTIERIFNHFPMLKERAHQKGVLLSGGEQQMLAIGRGLMGNPELLLVDEPTEGLAPPHGKGGAGHTWRDQQDRGLHSFRGT